MGDFWSDAVRNPVWSCPGCSCSSRLLPALPEYGPGSRHWTRPHLLHQVCPCLPNCLPLLERLPPLGLGHGPWFQLLSSTSLATLWWVCRSFAPWVCVRYRLSSIQFGVYNNPDY